MLDYFTRCGRCKYWKLLDIPSLNKIESNWRFRHCCRHAPVSNSVVGKMVFIPYKAVSTDVIERAQSPYNSIIISSKNEVNLEFAKRSLHYTGIALDLQTVFPYMRYNYGCFEGDSLYNWPGDDMELTDEEKKEAENIGD